ncbi:hypothetical protein F511_13352 [Dorcoceras hygrometricum]|uniref:Stress response protein NST1-like n=1 Tax=Dorcoceras hygrometricum TaxID=472368 RepID=A0A2Z7CCQ0_9LAMI|nr:hypothetical protein F511_13352 [Dorcoceras hygrometricum]
MKRKKWSELEEQTLLSKYSELLNSGTLSKLKTREKKFKPISDHVNSLHHLQDPITFPFKWSWRDVSIKVQNMRHQYLGVKQKIRINSSNEFNWGDGEIHWENFLKYKEVFGDIEISPDIGVKDVASGGQVKKFGEEGVADILGYGIESEEIDDEDELDEEEEEEEERLDFGASDEGEEMGKGSGNQDLVKGFKAQHLKIASAEVLELRDMICRREEKRRDREWSRDEMFMEKETLMKERCMKTAKRFKEREEQIYRNDMEFEETAISLAKRDFENRRFFEREFDEERRRRMKWEEKWEEEEMKWREKMVEMQMEHEKQILQIHADFCQNQMQILGVMARLVCQFFGSTGDSLGGGLGSIPIPPQVLQNLQHPGGLGDDVKPDSTSPSEFL